MAEQVISNKWRNIAPTPPTTFPTLWFSVYVIIAIIILPIHLVVVIVNYIYKLIIYIINGAFYFPTKALLKPIHPSPSSFVIITGAANGIGKDIALLFASKGFSLILIDVSPSVETYSTTLKNKFNSATIKHIIIDLSETLAAHKIYNTICNAWKLETVDILVNCAGFGIAGEFLNQDINRLRTMVNVNAICCMELGHKFGRYFVKRGQGRICQIASVAAFTPGPHSAVYHATKSFTRNWAIALQHELIGSGVGVTVICPGPVRTKFIEQSNSEKSLVWYFSWLNYSSMDVANAAVNATLNGKQEVVYGPLWDVMQGMLSFYGETFNIIATKMFWQDPNSIYRSPYNEYKYNDK